MKVGQKLLLHHVTSPESSSERDEIVIVTIQEEKEVPYTWGKGTGKGFRATDDQGREYQCNWTSFPDDSMTPYCHWFRVEPVESFWDTTLNYLVRPPFKPWFIGEEGYEFIDYCSRHRTLFYVEKDDFYSGCFDCYMEKEYGEDRSKKFEEPENWVGWRNPL
jgi:hypothetical protein